MSAKLLKFAKPAIVQPITNLINKSINNSIFPEKLKEAQVVPLFKKNNSLDKCNYRPVSILPTISKFYERAIYVFPFARYIADFDTLFSVREIIFYQFQCRFTYSVCI
jgi:CCR4-NOT transcriptional regulation complex NOT5 subunit